MTLKPLITLQNDENEVGSGKIITYRLVVEIKNNNELIIILHYLFKALEIRLCGRDRMKKLILGIGLVLSLALSVSGCGVLRSKLGPNEIMKEDGESTVALVYFNRENADREVSDVRVYCSAVWVDKTHILTAHHCVNAMLEKAQEHEDEIEEAEKADIASCDELKALFTGCDPNEVVKHQVVELQGLPIHYIESAEVEGIGKEPSAWHLSEVVGYDESHDVALLKADGKAIPEHKVAVLADAVPGMGEAVHVIGHVKGFYWTLLEGTVSGYRQSVPHVDTEGPFLQVEAPVYFGNSGGGAFNAYGELVGMADFLMDMPGQAFFVPVDTLRAFLVDQGVLEGKK